MKKPISVSTGKILDEHLEFSLYQICRYCDLESEQVVEMVTEGIVEPRGDRPVNWPVVTRSVPPWPIVPSPRWIAACIDRPAIATQDEICDNFTLPLLEQVKIDGGETVYKLAEGRLGVHSTVQTVRTQSRKMGVTRARVYQLLDDCCKIMNVRWPDGRRMVGDLNEQFLSEPISEEAQALFVETRDLFFPDKYELGLEDELA